MNRVTLIGNLGKDPQVRATQTGKAVASVSLATSFGKDNQKQTEWHNITAWEKTAEILGACVKGQRVYVEGYLRTRKYEDKNGGGTRYITEVVANSVHLVSWPNRAGAAVDPRNDHMPPEYTDPVGGMTDEQIPF